MSSSLVQMILRTPRHAPEESATELEDMMHLLVDLDDDFIISDHMGLLEQASAEVGLQLQQ